MWFTYNQDCVEAYKDALCYLNFPKCGCREESLPLCRSVCENYYRACGGGTEGSGDQIKECMDSFILEK